MLNPVAKKWVKALRSGKFKQIQNQLGKEDNQRCCLGVLCDLAVTAGIISDVYYSGTFLPDKVRDWAGLHSQRATYDTKRGRADRSLWQDNDGYDCDSRGKKTFSKIADIIESEPEGLFV